MPYNALIVASTSLPTRADQRSRLGVPPRRTDGDVRTVRLEALPAQVAAALHAAMVSTGGWAQIARDGGHGRVLLLQGDGAQFHALLRQAGVRHATLEAAAEIRAALIGYSSRPRALALARGRLMLGQRTLVMGVLNVTPDSFSDGGRFLDPRAAVERAHRMAREGADLIDVGGESTRPGARPVPLSEELRRVLPVIETLAGVFRVHRDNRPLLSVDTRRAEVARRAAAAGADLINDVSGMTHDPAMAATVADSGLPVVIQHARGTPQTMQRSPRYRHLLPEIAGFLRSRIDQAVRAGVREDRIVVDPGIGFGKRRRDNLAILRHLRALTSLGRPILIGASRKSFLKGHGDLPPADRLEASLAAEALAIAEGADIIRVHDVREGVRVAALCDAVLRDPLTER